MGSKRRQERRSRVFFQVFACFLYVNAFPDSQICAYAPGKRAGRYAGRSPRFSLSYISYNSGIFAIMSNDHLVAVPILHMHLDGLGKCSANRPGPGAIVWVDWGSIVPHIRF